MKNTTPASKDALELLCAEHEHISNLFRAYQNLRMRYAGEQKIELVDAICLALQFHTALEEDLVYPVARAVLGGEAMLDNAEVEHSAMRELCGHLEAMVPDDAYFDATVAVLAEEAEQHMRTEERELFPALRSSGADLALLARQLCERRTRLEVELGVPLTSLNGAEPAMPALQRPLHGR